jgi:hypothetical protein
VSQDSVGPVLLGASRDSVTDVARGGVLESGVKLLAWEGKRNVWGGGVDIDGSGGKLVTDRRSLRGGGGTAAVVVHAFTTWTIGSPYGPVAGVKVMLHVSVIGPASLQRQTRSDSGRPSQARCHARHRDPRSLCDE